MEKLSAVEILDWIEGTAAPGDSLEQIKGRFQKMFCQGAAKAQVAQLERERGVALLVYEMKRR